MFMKSSNPISLMKWLLIAVLSSAFDVLAVDSVDETISRPDKVRTIITTDPELDDNNSLIRFLLYSNEVNLEGLITASGFYHWRGDGHGTVFKGETESDRFGLGLCPCKEWRWYDNHIQDVVDAYEQVYDNLRRHDSHYPQPDALRGLIRVGNVAFPADISKPSPGSDLIRDALLDDKPGPLYLQVWGGPSTVARALLSIEEQYSATAQWPQIRDKVSGKAIIVAFGEQDSSYRDYIAANWPEVRFWQLASQIWGYGARDVVLPGDEKYLSSEWLQKHVTSKGPLGAIYRVWGDGKQMVKGDVFDPFGYADVTAEELKRRGYIVWTSMQPAGAWISEGDTTAFLNLVNNGLRSHQHPGWGGWGGRALQNPDDNSEWTGEGVIDLNDFTAARRADFRVARWFDAAQRDFAARLQWSVTGEYKKANHHPNIQGAPQSINVQAGQQLELSASVSDPDNDAIELHWWQYNEAGTYPESLSIGNAHQEIAIVTIPANAQPGQSIHIILEATDTGSPALKRYHRVVLKVVRPPE